MFINKRASPRQPNPFRPSLVCPDCRKIFKRRVDAAVIDDRDWICANCGKKADYVGPKF